MKLKVDKGKNSAPLIWIPNHRAEKSGPTAESVTIAT
jgi:hypothetical protein